MRINKNLTDVQRIEETPADNVRFGASGAVTPQTILWEIEHYYPR